MDPTQRVVPSREDPLARQWVDFIGGPRGRYAAARQSGWWTPLRLIIALTLSTLSLGFLSKAACLTGVRDEAGHISLNWAGNRQYAAACYNDIVPLYAGRGLDQPGFVYAFSWTEGDLTRYMEYPVLAGLFQGAMGWIARSTYAAVQMTGLAIPAASWYFMLTALALSVLWVLTVVMVADLLGNRLWDVVLVAASPLVIVHAFSNWDIPSIFLVVAALWMARRDRFLVAGACVGAGTAFKMWPLFLLGAYLIVALRHRRVRDFVAMTLSAMGVWSVLNVPIMLAYPKAWGEFFRLNSERSWEWTTIWAVLSRRTGWSGFDASGTPEILNLVTFVLFAGCCLAIFILGLKVRRRPRIAELIVLIVAAFLLLNKVWSPQYSLWLVIPLVLALPRWRLLGVWMLSEALVWPILMWHMMGEDNLGAPGWLLDVAILTRDGILITLIVLVVRQMLGATRDKVRCAHGGLDPLLPGTWHSTPGDADRQLRKAASCSSPSSALSASAWG